MQLRNRITQTVTLIAMVATMIGGTGFATAQTTSGKWTSKGAPVANLQSNTSADSKPDTASTISSTGMTSVFIKLSSPSLASYMGDGFSLDSPEAVAYLAKLNGELDQLEARIKAKLGTAAITHRFDVILGGLSVMVPADQLDALKGIPNVEQIMLDRVEKLQTDRTPTFIGATNMWNDLGGQESAGEGVIVGVLDTGIWPEHPSFADPDPSGKAFAAPPAPRDNPARIRNCTFGRVNPLGNDPAFSCNNKLIGAYRFMSTYSAIVPLAPGEFRSARDDDGHGSHTAGTSAGNANVAASIFGVSRGIISGIAPRAHVIAYKVCGAQGCFSTDSAAAVQQAIRDNVNVINFSISGGANPFADAVSLAFKDAYKAGVFIAASAGNAGPGADTTDHREPWVTTVAASTATRAFKNTLTLVGNAGATLSFRGTSLTSGTSAPAPVVKPTNDNFCIGPFAPGTFTGKIVVCQRGGGPGRVQKGFNVLKGGAVGMILYNTDAATTDQETDNHFLPTTHIQFSEGQQVLAFLAANPGATASLTAGVADVQQGDVMASFSSRGGPGQSLGVSKPDITAPGVQILAAHTPASVDLATGPQGELFQAIAGTSMSSPHIAGSAALIKALHPSWSPGQIKSAMMLTAKTKGLVKEDGVTPFTPFDAGSGRVDLRKAGTPMLSISASGTDFETYRNELWKANYPSIYVPVMPGIITIPRTLQDVSGTMTMWEAKVTSAADVKISLPEHITVQAGGSVTIQITIDARDVPLGQVRHSTIVLEGAEQDLHIPVTIVRKQAVVTLATGCDSNTIARNATMNCSITAANTTFDPATISIEDRLPRGITLLDGSRIFRATGTLAGAEPVNVTIATAPGGSPAGYFSLSNIGTPAIAGQGDETSANFNVPAFTFGGQTYTRIGMVSNGYAVIGGTNGNADIQFINQSLPNPNRPNNVLAPFWTDLNPAFGGTMKADILTDGVSEWLVLEWENVREFSTANTASFQIWIGLNGTDDVTFTYGIITGNGDGGFATVGAENNFGNRGQNYYVDGIGTLPAAGDELRVTPIAGAPGESRTYTFGVKGERVGAWRNYAMLSSNLFDGINTVGFSGTTTR